MTQRLTAVLLSFFCLTSATWTAAQGPTPQRVRVSPGVMEKMLIKKVDPIYPADAHIEGSVVLTVIVDKEGNVSNIQLISGHPMLAPAAIDAVKQWKYKPFLLNGEPVMVETQVTVNFVLPKKHPTK
jgi:TonB family protein